MSGKICFYFVILISILYFNYKIILLNFQIFFLTLGFVQEATTLFFSFFIYKYLKAKHKLKNNLKFL